MSGLHRAVLRVLLEIQRDMDLNSETVVNRWFVWLDYWFILRRLVNF